MTLTIDGHRAHLYHHASSGAKPTFVMVHGGGLDRTAWLPPATRLARQGFGVVVPDLPGHGGSAGDALGDIGAMARWTVQVCDELGIVRPYLAGHSMGAMVALECAVMLQDREMPVRGLAMLATAFPLSVSPRLLKTLAENEPEAQLLINRWSHAMHHGNAPTQLADVMERNLACMRSQRPGVALVDFSACDRYDQGWERAATIRCPTLLLTAELDRMTPASASEPLAKALGEVTSTRVTQVPEAGHNLMGERPEFVAEALASFCYETLF